MDWRPEQSWEVMLERQMGQDPQNPVDHMQTCGIMAVGWSLKQVGRQVCGLEARAVMGGDAGEADGSGPAEPCRSHADLWDSGCWMESCGEPRKTLAMVRASECGEWTQEAVWARGGEEHWGEVPWAVCSSRVRSRIALI